MKRSVSIRLRPVLMTTIATIAAATPLIFGNSIGQETRTPMGLTIVGGSLISTVFTLLVVPSLYMMLTFFESKKARVELHVGSDPEDRELLPVTHEVRAAKSDL